MLLLSRIRQGVQSSVCVPDRNGCREAPSAGLRGRSGPGDMEKEGAWQFYLARLTWEKRRLPRCCETFNPDESFCRTERDLQDPSAPYLDRQECFPSSRLGTPLKYGQRRKYFHPGTSCALVSQGIKCRNVGWKYAPSWCTILAAGDRVGRAEEGTDAQRVLGPSCSVM